MLPLEDAEAGRLLAGIGEEERSKCWWLFLPDGTVLPGDGGGGVALLAEVRLTRPVARVLRASRASSAVDALDRIAAGQRGRLGRIVPEGAAPRLYP